MRKEDYFSRKGVSITSNVTEPKEGEEEDTSLSFTMKLPVALKQVSMLDMETRRWRAAKKGVSG